MTRPSSCCLGKQICLPELYQNLKREAAVSLGTSTKSLSANKWLTESHKSCSSFVKTIAFCLESLFAAHSPFYMFLQSLLPRPLTTNTSGCGLNLSTVCVCCKRSGNFSPVFLILRHIHIHKTHKELKNTN